MTNLVLMRETNLLDVVATLRRIADEIEIGEHGAPQEAVVVLDTDTSLEVFFMGKGEAAPSAFLLLHAGAAKMMKAVTDLKG